MTIFFVIISHFITLVTGDVGLPYLFYDNEQLIRKHIEESERKEKLYLVLDEFKDDYKPQNEALKKQLKALQKMSAVRTAEPEALDLLLAEYVVLLQKVQENSFVACFESRSLVQKSEWQLIKDEFYLKNKQQIKATDKEWEKVERKLQSFRQKVERVVLNSEDAAQIIRSLNRISAALLADYEAYRELMLDPSSRVYQLDFTQEQMLSLQEAYVLSVTQFLQGIIDFHFVLKDCTNEKEWRKLNRSFNVYF